METWKKQPILLLDNSPWKPPSEHGNISDDEVDNNLAIVPFQQSSETFVEGTSAEVRSSKDIKGKAPSDSAATSASTSLVLETLNELKKENEAVRERLDKQDETNNEIKNWMVKQEESTSEIKNLLLNLASRLT